MVLIFTMA